MVQAMSPVGAFLFYAGLNVVALIMIFFTVPETKQSESLPTFKLAWSCS